MPLSHIEHFLLQTDDMEATRDWYVRVLGMRVGPSPDFKFPVFWLYLGDKDVVHVTQGGEGVSENRKHYVGSSRPKCAAPASSTTSRSARAA
jgi:catechol 2,3-dioxygenase-like lactoylglutathione lyase family enzyme